MKVILRRHMTTITIDFGASFIKAATVLDGRIRKRKDKKTPVNSAEKDVRKPVKINEIVKAVRELLEELSEGEEEVNLCFSNEMHGFILMDENGLPYTDYISWQEEYGRIEISGESSYDILKREQYKEEIRNTGMFVRAGLPSANLLYLKRAGIVNSQTLSFLTLGDAIIKMLFGVNSVCHISNAAATGLYDLKERCWNRILSELIGENIIFPPVGNSVTDVVYKNVKYHIFPAIGDYQAALLGAGIERDTDISFNLGTGAQVSRLTEGLAFSEKYQILPFFYGKYIKRIPHLPSGRALNVYYRFTHSVLKQYGIELEEEDIWSGILAAAECAQENNLSCSLSFFENPINRDVRGKIEEIGEYEFTFSNLMNCVFEQECRNFIWASEQIGEEEIPVTRIIFSGGIAKKISVIREGIIEYFGRQTETVIAENETLIGLYNYSRMLEVER